MNQWQIQLLVPVISVAGSFTVAWFTVKHQAKQVLLEKRYEVYKNIFEYLLKLKRDPGYRRKEDSLCMLLNLEVDAGLCGTKRLVSQVETLRESLEQSLAKQRDALEYERQQYANELAYRCEQLGETPEEAEIALYDPSLDDENYEPPYGLSDEFINVCVADIVHELRRSLGYKEFRPAIWFRKTWLSKKTQL